MAQWSKQFKDISTVNNGNEYAISDVPTLDMANVPMNNTQWLKEKTEDLESDVEEMQNDIETNQNDIFDIKQRLDNLGFKYPPTSQTIYLNVGGTNVLSIIITAGASGDRTRTSREGNRTLLTFNVNMLSGYSSSTPFYNFYRNSYEATANQPIPEVYRPNVAQEFYIPSGNVEYRYTNQSTTYASVLKLPIKISLGTDGIFKAQILSTSLPVFPGQIPLTYYYNYGNNISMSIGYTNAPIS